MTQVLALMERGGSEPPDGHSLTIYMWGLGKSRQFSQALALWKVLEDRGWVDVVALNSFLQVEFSLARATRYSIHRLIQCLFTRRAQASPSSRRHSRAQLRLLVAKPRLYLCPLIHADGSEHRGRMPHAIVSCRAGVLRVRADQTGTAGVPASQDVEFCAQ